MGKMQMTLEEVKRRMKNGANVKTIAELNDVTEQTVRNFLKKGEESEAAEIMPEANKMIKEYKQTMKKASAILEQHPEGISVEIRQDNSRTIDNGRLKALYDMANENHKFISERYASLNGKIRKLEKKINRLSNELERAKAERRIVYGELTAAANIVIMAKDFVNGTLTNDFAKYVSLPEEDEEDDD